MHFLLRATRKDCTKLFVIVRRTKFKGNGGGGGGGNGTSDGGEV